MMTNVHNDSQSRAMESLNDPAMETLCNIIQFDTQTQINRRMVEVAVAGCFWFWLVTCGRQRSRCRYRMAQQ